VEEEQGKSSTSTKECNTIPNDFRLNRIAPKKNAKVNHAYWSAEEISEELRAQEDLRAKNARARGIKMVEGDTQGIPRRIMKPTCLNLNREKSQTISAMMNPMSKV